ncbi:hypothetical protein ROLI_006020 [Roseobacter fucihabitans]|uniref:Uncharacterized protein n=1 Tax=Roseobacter fucihabitans TaxID=1537242 RepID=A0ABZ2BQM4_9RHOB|nr:hypothetical protein [Roseobacter litoralis]MBC6966222.1 hypothetical protein [Roseobacter litoralis]
MAKFEIVIPFGRLEASSYSELKLLVETELAFWDQFDFESFEDGFEDQGFKRISNEFKGRLQSFTSFWPKHLKALEAIDGREFASKFEIFNRNVVDDQVVPPWSQSAVARSAISEMRQNRIGNAALLLIGFIWDEMPRTRNLNNHQSQDAAFFGAARSFYASTLSLSEVNTMTVVSDVADETILLAKTKLRDLASEIDAVQKEREDDTQRVIKLLEEFETRNKAVVDKYGRGLIEQKNMSVANEERRQETFDNLLAAFNVHLKISTPVKLWESLEKRHRDASKDAWILFVVGCVCRNIHHYCYLFWRCY